ncbi:Hypothetical protein NTJ_03877 [Nesidiocoris tenuis]|uniref:Uncharacterized protein n=1 Tax=Nesidiocoris tenuis TaxID=355587 RepID=A0ABN7AI71_9HEMI|nr:Hypothetical protein NTJ_03877 [Nesidiocoris tenuis]
MPYWVSKKTWSEDSGLSSSMEWPLTFSNNSTFPHNIIGPMSSSRTESLAGLSETNTASIEKGTKYFLGPPTLAGEAVFPQEGRRFVDP